MQHARHELAADPTDATIERFTALEEKFRELGGYEAESEVSRLAAGLGLKRTSSWRTSIRSRAVSVGAST